MNTRPTRWYHRLFYRWSMPYRFDVERALRWQYSLGYGRGRRDAMQHMPWPYEAQTDPLQHATPKRQTVPLAKNGDYVRMVREQPGRTIHTQLLFAMGKVQLAQLQANMREQEAPEREESNG